VEEQYKRGGVDGNTEVFILPDDKTPDGLQSDRKDDGDDGSVQSSRVSPPKASVVDNFLPSKTRRAGEVDNQIPASLVPEPEPIELEQLPLLRHCCQKKDLEILDLRDRLDDKDKMIAALISALRGSRNNADRVESSSEHRAVEPRRQNESAEELEAGLRTTEIPFGKVGGHAASRHHSQFLSGTASESPRRKIDSSPACESPGRTEQASDALSATETSLRGPTMVKRVGAVTLRVEVLSYLADAASSGSSSEDVDDMVSMSRFSQDSEGEYMDTTSLVDEETGQGQSPSHNTAQDAEAPAQQPSGSSTTILPVNPGGSASHHGRENSKDEDDDGRRRKKRRLSKALGAPDPLSPSLRLACPYQVCEPWRRCFQQASGCEDIARLKYNIPVASPY
jgi:hypothetical protein